MATVQPKTLRTDKLRTAYTLVELLVVMAALTVLAAVTLPSIRSLLHDQKVTAAARMVKAHFEAAQARAIAGNSPVSAIMERRDASSPNTVSRLSIGQVFPPYAGDTADAVGTLSSTGGTFYDTLTVSLGDASLLKPDLGIFGQYDYLQLDDRQSIYLINSISLNKGNNALVDISFINPATGQEANLQSSARWSATARFRIYRKPNKSFLQTLTLPRGTCIDLSVSGLGLTGNQFSTSSVGYTTVVFNPQGRIAYWDNGDGVTGPQPATSLLHLMVGRTEQVSASVPPMEVADPDDTSTFNANVNDNANSWLTINPFTGAITSSGLQAGGETGTFAGRLGIARTFATYGIAQNEN